MDTDIKEIDSITFGIYSPEEIIKMAVCKIDNTKLNGEIGSVYDPRMGTIENGKICPTCSQNQKNCTGHFGYIELNEHIINPLFYKEVRDMLSFFCIKCYRLLITKEQIKLNGLSKLKARKLLKEKKIEECAHCEHPQPEFKYSPNENIISMIYKQKASNKVSVVLTVEEIETIFNNVLNEDLEIIGYDPNLVHPRNFIMSLFPVIPPNARPWVIADGNYCDDDLTNQLIEIIKSNNHLTKDEENMSESKRQKHLQSLKFRILTFINNSCLHPDTKVLLWNGCIKTAKEIIVGDELIGDDGEKRTVEKVCEGYDEMFEITQMKGEKYIVNRNHVLSLKYPQHKKSMWINPSISYPKGSWVLKWFNGEKLKYRYFQPNNYVSKQEAYNNMMGFSKSIEDSNIFDIEVAKYMTFSKHTKKCLKGFKLSSVVNWDHKHVEIDPYVMGMWLGNGNKSGSGFISADEELIQYWKNWSEKNGCEVILGKNKLKEGNKLYVQDKVNYRPFGIKNKLNNSDIKNPFKEMLKIYNLIDNKHIPKEYLHNDENTRLQLLAGLIDTDGWKEKNIYCISQSSSQRTLIYQIQYLANSLGFQTSMYKKANKEKKSELKYVLYISSINNYRIPVKLERKKCNNMIDTSIYSIEVKSIGLGKYNGFTINKNHRFLLNDFTVTHNSGKAKHSSGRPIKSLKERMSGKQGQIRSNLMGKRCDQTGRTVIGPDPTLKMGQLAVPVEMANNLTVPVKVAKFNYDYLTNLVNSGGANYVLKNEGKTRINLNYALFRKGTELIFGDEIHTKRNGKEVIINVKTGKEKLMFGDRIKRGDIFLKDIKYPEKKNYKLEIGDIVERKLQNGDIVLLNRQPTLWKGSMMAQEVVIKPYKTLRFNLSINKSFNADFDGDEMNIHVPQSLEAQAELRLLSASKNMIINPQSSKTNMCIVQDSLLGAYKMTLGDQKLRKDQFFDIAMKTEMTSSQILDKIQHIRKILQEKGKKVQCFNGRGLISLILPTDFIYEKKNNAHPDEPILKIYRGVLYEGTLDKSILGSVHNSIIQILNKEYNPETATEFIDNIQFITNAWLLISSFSIGLGDCLVSGVKQTQEIEDVIQKCYIEAEGIKTTTNHKGVREMRITSALSKAKDIGLRIAKESLAKDNNFLSTVRSGSKGDYFNVAQITGLLGQQNLMGQRVPPVLNHGKRTLPHYPFGDLPLEMEYESKGFIASSFIKGMNPREFYFHAMSGREGVCDTAMGTAKSGYIQRRIIKLTEDIKVSYDGTVRDASGKIFQMAYGDDGLDPVHTIKVNGNQEACDISRMVEKLNMQHENTIKPTKKLSKFKKDKINLK